MQCADYLVSGVWKEQTKISYLMLHLNNPNGFDTGRKVSAIYVMDLIKKGSVIFALQWNYNRGRWLYIAPLEISRSGIEEYLYCKYSEAGVQLENLINMTFLGNGSATNHSLIRRKNAAE